MAVNPDARATARAGPAGFEVRAITGLEAWRALAGDWDRMLRATPGYRPLQCFDFLHTWWTHMSGDRRLFILAFFDGARLAGIAPLQIAYKARLGRRRRIVQFVGMTEDILLPTLLFPEPDAPVLRRLLMTYLAEHREAWDAIELDELAFGDPATEALEAFAARSGFLYRTYPFHDCPFLDLSEETPESFWRKRSRKLLKNVRASARKLDAIGAVAVDTFESPAEVRRGLDAFLQVARASWKAKARIGMADDPRYAPFYAALLEAFAERGAARVMILRVGDRPIAGTFAIMLDGVYCSLQITHDEQYAKYSPGTLLEYHELDALVRAGSVRRYEFLGGALRNKLRWTSDFARSACVSIAQPSLAARLADAYTFEAKPRAKRALRLAARSVLAGKSPK